jgi:hypothetical protein
VNDRASNGRDKPRRIEGHRSLPVAVVDRADLARLGEVFEGRRLAVARSIYLALTERTADADRECTRRELADDAGVSRKTLDEYVPEFEAAGLLHVERRREGAENLSNVWTLISVAPYESPRANVQECVYCGADSDTLDHVLAKTNGGGNRGNVVPACRSCNSSKNDYDVREWIERGGRRSWPEVAAALVAWGVRSVPGVGGSVPSHGEDPVHPSTDSSEMKVEVDGTVSPACLPTLPGLDVTLPGLSRSDPPISISIDEVPVPALMVQDAGEQLRRKVKVDGRLVTPREMSLVAVVMAEFNRQSGSDYGIGAHVKPIVGRIRERPSYDAGAHVRLVQSAWRLRWWERNGRGRRPTPAVIYGNAGVFEQVVQDAVDEKAGKAPDVGEQAMRYTRED